MADLSKQLQQKLDEVQKKHPDLSLRWLDSNPDVLRERTQGDGWNVYKESDQTKAGVVGEVRVGDLVLGARPRKEVEQERRELEAKTRDQIHAPLNTYYGDLERMGAGGKYIRPMTPGELERDKGNWKGGR